MEGRVLTGAGQGGQDVPGADPGRPTVRDLIRELSTGQGPAARVGRGTGSAFAIKVAGTGIVFLNQLILARVLGAEVYGRYVYAITWVTLLGVLGMAGTDTAAVRFVGAYVGTGAFGRLRGFLRFGARRVVLASLGLGAALGVAAIALGTNVSPELRAVLLVGALLLPAQVFLQFLAAVTRGFQRIVPAQLPPEVLRPALFGGGILAVHWIGGVRPSAADTMGWNLAVTLGVVAVALVLLRSSLATIRGVRAESDRLAWAAMAWPVLLIAGLNLILSQTDTIMLGMLRDTTTAGIYAVASRLASFVSFMLVSAGAVAAPMIAQFHAAGDRRRLQRLLTVSVRGVTIFAVPAAAVLILAGRWVLGWFGEEFPSGYSALTVLTAGQVVNSACGLVGVVLVMTGRQSVAARILGVAALANVSLNVVMIPILGPTGAALATCATLVGWNVSMVVVVRRSLGVRPGVV